MNAEHPRLEQMFRDALELPSGEERERYLSAECRNDEALRRRVESLLRAHSSAGRFLDPASAPGKPGRPGLAGDGSGVVRGIPGLRVLERVAEGGFCVVYLAEQIEPMRRPVALKILKPGLEVRMGNLRFEAERQALAVMDHPNIARIYDAGSTSNGLPFLVLEWIRGSVLSHYADAERLTLRARLALFLHICAGIAHAHARGVIHRDIKPANILVPEYDGVAVPKIIDFGTALGLGVSGGSGFQAAGGDGFVGTPAYMSPEQAFGGSGGVDTRTDVFSLGVVLYELLTGLPPFEGEKRTHVDAGAVRGAIRSRRFLAPSMRVVHGEPERILTAAAKRRRKPAELAAGLRGDLDAILARTLEVNRENRYATVNDLADDIRQHLGNRQVSVAKATWSRRCHHFLLRHAAVLMTAGAVSAVLLVALAVMLFQGKQSRSLRRQSVWQEAAVTAAEQQHREMQSQQLVSFGLEAVRHQNAAEAMAWFSQAARLALPDSRERRLHERRVHALAAAVALPVRALQLSGSLRSLEFSAQGGYLLALTQDGQCTVWDWQADQVLEWSRGIGPVTAAEWSSAEEQVALGLDAGAVEIRRVPTGELVRRLDFGESIGALRFSPDGGQLAVAGTTVRLWQESQGGWLPWQREHPAPVFALRYSADGRSLVSACLDRQARVFSLAGPDSGASGSPGGFRHESGLTGFTAAHCAAALIPTDPLAPVFYGADNRLLTWTAMGELTAWDAAEGRILRTLEGTCLATRLVQSPGGEWIAVTFPYGSAQFWRTGAFLGDAAASVKHQERICDLAFGPQAEWVLTASADRTARLWQLPQGTPMLSPLAHSCEVVHGAVSPSGRWVGTAQLDGQLRVWRLPRSQDEMQSVALGLPGRWDGQASPGGRQILLTRRVGDGPEDAVLLHGEDAQYDSSRLELPGELVAAAWSVEGDSLATLTRPGRTDPDSVSGRLELRTNGVLSDAPWSGDLPFVPSGLAWHPEGHRLVISDTVGGLWAVNLDGPMSLGAWAAQAEGMDGRDDALVFSADGDCLVRCSAQGRIEVLEGESGRLRFALDSPNAARRRVTVSPTEAHLLVTYADGASQVIHLEDGRVLGNPLRHPGGVVAQGFSPDGRWVVTSGHDGRLRIQDWLKGELVCPELVHTDEVFGFAFSSDGGWLASVGRDGTFYVWDMQSGADLLPVESVDEPLFGVRLDADDRYAVLLGAGSTVWVRNLLPLQQSVDWSVEELTILSEAASGLAMDREPPTKLSSEDWQERMTQILSLRPDYFRP